MKYASTTIITAIGLALMSQMFLSSCNNKGTENDSISFEVYSCQKNFQLEGSAKDYGTDSDIVFCDSVNLLMPKSVYKNDISALRDSVMMMAFDTTGTDVASLAEAYALKGAGEAGYKAKPIERKFKDLTVPDSYVLVTGDVVRMSPEWISYCVTTSDYMARAAHGMSSKNYINYLPRENRILSLYDIFDRAKTDSLASLISKEASSMEAILGPTNITALPSDNNFYVNEAGEIVFVYQPYEVASYAQGYIMIPFYPYELSNYMTPGGLKTFSLQDLE